MAVILVLAYSKILMKLHVAIIALVIHYVAFYLYLTRVHQDEQL